MGVRLAISRLVAHSREDPASTSPRNRIADRNWYEHRRRTADQVGQITDLRHTISTCGFDDRRTAV